MISLTLTKAIIMSNRPQVRTALRDELKHCAFNSNDIVVVHDPEEYRKAALEAGPVFFLVLDWETGPDLVLEILAKNKAAHKIESRPTFLIAAKLDYKVVTVAAEYHVNKVHIGTITGEKIRFDITQMTKEAKNLSLMRQLLIQVETCRTRGKWEDAGHILNQLHSKYPDNPRIMVELAENFMETDQWEKAEVFLDIVMEKEPGYARARHLMARCFLKRGDKDEAIECLKDAQLISPLNVNRLVEMGNMLLEQSRPQEARKAFEDILEIAPKSNAGVAGKASSMLVLGEVNEALAILREAASPRELAAVFNTTAILAINKGDFANGMDLYQIAQKALGERPKVLARLLYNMGIGYYKWKKPQESIKCFREALKFDPSFDDAAYNAKAMQKALAKPASPTARPPSPAAPEPFSLGDDDLLDAAIDNALASSSVTVIGGKETSDGKAAPKSVFATNFEGMFDEDKF